MTLSSRLITEGKGKAHAFWTHIGCSINNGMMELPFMRGYERQDLFDGHGPRLLTTTRRNPGAKELRDALKALHPNLDFRAAAHGHAGDPIAVTWPVDNGRSQVTRTSHPPFTPVDREEGYRVAYEVFSQRLRLAFP